MVAPLQHVDVAQVVGSWPIIPTTPGSTPTLLPDTVLSQAAILGVRQEPAAGFDVGSKSFNLYVDSPTVFSAVSFTAGNKTLAEVITQINTDTGVTVAHNDNGFLRLKSPTTGGASYLRVASIATASDVLYELGLFPDTIVQTGDLVPAGHPDPFRQVSMPGQMTMAEGEAFSTKAINRAVFQLGVNTDRNEGLLSRKRLAVQKTVAEHTYASPGTPEGYLFSGGVYVYTGPSSPSIEDLEKLFVVLDADGREFTKEMETVTSTGGSYFSVDAETGKQYCTQETGGAVFLSTDTDGDVYVRSSATGVPGLEGELLKIVEFIDTATVVVSPIDPATGAVTTFSAGSAGGGNGVAVDRVVVSTVKCVVDKVTKTSAGSTRVEGLEESRYSGALVVTDRVELNNRLVITGAGFNTLSPPVEVGNVLTWTGHAVTAPFSNNGTYRVSQVIDDETIELVGEDWGPVFLNSDLYSGAAGSIDISTDGQFWKDPFIQFKAGPDGAIPEDGVDDIRILYLGMSTFREATDDPVAFGGGLEWKQEVDDTVQKTLLAIIGPGPTTINEYLHGDRRQNLEDVDFRLRAEHYTRDELHSDTVNYPDPIHAGRHRNIRPDTIEMFPENPGPIFTAYADPDDAASVVQLRLLHQFTGGVEVFQVRGGGDVYSRKASAPTASFCYISGETSTVWCQNSEASGTAYMQVVGEGSNAKAVLDISSVNTQSDAAIGAAEGATRLRMYADSAGDSPAWSFNTRAGATPYLRLDSVAFNDANLMRWDTTGRTFVGEGYSTGKGTLTVSGGGGSEYQWIVGGQTLYPEVLAFTPAGGGSSGFVWSAEDDNLETGGNSQAGFMAAYPFADGANNDSGAWKAYKLMTEATLVERFAVNKYGEGFFGYDGTVSTINFMPGDVSSSRPHAAYFNGNIVVGDVAELVNQPWLGTDVFDRNDITFVAGSQRAGALVAGAESDAYLDLMWGALRVDTGSGPVWATSVDSGAGASRVRLISGAGGGQISFDVNNHVGTSERDTVVWVPQMIVNPYFDSPNTAVGVTLRWGLGFTDRSKAVGDLMAETSTDEVIYSQSESGIAAKSGNAAPSRMDRLQVIDTYCMARDGDHGDSEGTVNDTTPGTYPQIGTTETAWTIDGTTIESSIGVDTLREKSIIKFKVCGFYDNAGTGAIITIRFRLGPSVTALASRNAIGVLTIPASVVADRIFELRGEIMLGPLASTPVPYYTSYVRIYSDISLGTPNITYFADRVTTGVLDESVIMKLTPTVEFGTADLGNTVELYFCHAEVI
jgi:hypothetical protein